MLLIRHCSFHELFYASHTRLSLPVIILFEFLWLLWFYFVYLGKGTAVSFGNVLSWCVIPFIGPDLVKGLFSVIIGEKLLKSTPLGKYKFNKSQNELIVHHE